MRRLTPLICAAFLAELAAQSIPEPGRELVLDAVTRATTRYVPLLFRTHQEHVDRLGGSCVECHHLVDDKRPEEHSCSHCHNQPNARLDLKAAGHQTCRGCHRNERRRTDRPPPSPSSHGKAPIECLECHTERGRAVPPVAGDDSSSPPGQR